jgi:hypothetical protein
MSIYGTQSPPPALFPFPPGHAFLVFNAEAVVAGEYSQQVALPTGPTAGQRGIRVEIDFSADPGAGEFYVMEGDNDSAGSGDYDQVPAGGDLAYGNITAGPNGVNTRLSTDLIPIAGQFVLIYCKTKPSNAGIKVTARISRAA